MRGELHKMAKRMSLAESVSKRAEATKTAETVKVTFELEAPIYTRLRVFTANTRKSARTVLTDALKDYLAKHA